MAGYKPMHQGLKRLALDFDRQILPGTFEYALRHLVDHELDLESFYQRYKNDVQGAAAFNPAALLKIILLAYSRGIIGSRKMEAACREIVHIRRHSGRYGETESWPFYEINYYRENQAD